MLKNYDGNFIQYAEDGTVVTIAVNAPDRWGVNKVGGTAFFGREFTQSDYDRLTADWEEVKGNINDLISRLESQ